ncbi:heavy metal translocating P-type ATPase [Simiduia sp. 21SJ11W-1]|uniref:heavy metal translocating P-type ATPase n=1 Tax=Simiduia sp. 21SJ11W-1 TaxID=2909669 RepID=UPI0020A10280|nr:heavy metal translocating P-type ATPase [Simiduia sp. 21SJ11W-1]UTA47229.1 heavy metal translocating P-type ATPase [Simiduia sp. 21SJ11W-1]
MTHCYHCQLPVPGKPITVEIQGKAQPMCCPGCAAVAQAIVGAGLQSFYNYREAPSHTPEQTGLDFAAFDLPEIQADFVTGESHERRAHLLLDGITCAACVWLIEQHLQRMAGVQKVSVNASTHRATITFNSETIALSAIMGAARHIGYNPLPASDDNQRALWAQARNTMLMRLGVAGFGMMQVMMVAIALYAGALQDFEGVWQNFFRWVSLIVATPVVLYSAQPFFVGAWRSLKMKQLVMDVPVAIAIGGAYLASVWATLSNSGEVYFESVSMFTFFLLLGRYIEQRLRQKNANSLAHVALRMPLTARRKTPAGKVEVVAVKQLSAGDTLHIRPGDTCPCDGVILSGHSRVDEALLTGESEPVLKQPGDTVIAGSVNFDSELWVQARATGAQTQLSAIEQLVARADAEKPQQVSAADKLARFFVARLLVVAALVGGFWCWYQPEQAFWVTLSVLVVTCPCALSLATPVALTRAHLLLREAGLLVTRGHWVDAISRVDTLVFDKTGTLTEGESRLIDVQLLREDLSEDHCVALVQALEANSPHPIARAFKHLPARWAAAAQETVEISDGVQHPNLGVSASWQGRELRFGRLALFDDWYQPAAPDVERRWLLLGDAHSPLAWFALEDPLRADAPAAVAAFLRAGKQVRVLSGDQTSVVAHIAARLQLPPECAEAGLLPDEKLKRVQQLQAQGHCVLMVGDGINDVPVLAAADVSVAMAGATDLAQARADSLLTNGKLLTLLEGFAIARRARRTIKQNLSWALAYNVVALPFAALGWVPPYVAAAGMSASSLLVVFNALRLKREVRPEHKVQVAQHHLEAR